MSEDGDSAGAEGEASQQAVPAGGPSLWTGATDIQDGLDFPVHILAFAALRSVSSEIAERVAPVVGSRPVVLADEGWASTMSDWRLLEARMTALEGALGDAIVAASSENEAEVTEAALGLIGAATEGFETLSNLLSWLRVDTTWKPATVTADAALRPSLIGQLLAKGIEPVEPALGSPSLGGGERTLVASLHRLLHLRSEALDLVQQRGNLKIKAAAGKHVVEALSVGDSIPAEPLAADTSLADPAVSEAGAAGGPRERLTTLAAEVDALVEEIRGGDAAAVRALVVASEVAALVASDQAAFLLDAKVLKAGGHSRTRSHLFSGLFGSSRPSFGGGAAVAFTLTDLGRRRLALSDVLFEAFDDVRFADTPATVSASNLVSSRGPSSAPALPSPDSPAMRDRSVPTPNSLDDEEAEAGNRSVEPSETEATDAWRLAGSLKTLRHQINGLSPRRRRDSDGAVGDASHRTRNSDHNPWVRDGAMGVVTAIDVTHDPAGGCSAEALAEALRRGRDRRVKYIIWNRRIANSAPIDGAAPWAWRPYGGKNPHTKHIHISVKPEKRLYDSTETWRL